MANFQYPDFIDLSTPGAVPFHLVGKSNDRYVIWSETGDKAMSIILRFLSGRGRVPCAFALLALLFSAPLAHASTFNFSFTTTDLLGALKGSDTSFQSDAYYAIFLQPTVMPTGDSLVASETAGRTRGTAATHGYPLPSAAAATPTSPAFGFSSRRATRKRP